MTASVKKKKNSVKALQLGEWKCNHHQVGAQTVGHGETYLKISNKSFFYTSAQNHEETSSSKHTFQTWNGDTIFSILL